MSYKLILRSKNSPFNGQFSDVNLGSVLSHSDLDNNFINIKGNLIYTADTSGTTLTMYKINGETIPVDLSELIDAGDTFISGITFNNSNYDLTLFRNDGVSFTENLSILSNDVTVTGGTYDISTGVVTFRNNSGYTFSVTGFTSGMTDSYTTAATLSGTVLSFDNNIQGANLYSVNLSGITSDIPYIYDTFANTIIPKVGNNSATDNIGTNSYSNIGGGTGNTIGNGGLSVIGDNLSNTIGGGRDNSIYQSTTSMIGGGIGNILSGASHSFIGGGINNYISSPAYGVIKGTPSYGASAIVGGKDNFIGRVVSPLSAVTFDYPAGLSIIGGGMGNEIRSNNYWYSNSIVGGHYNKIIAPIVGTVGNEYANYVGFSHIGGGKGNTIHAYNANIGGGYYNIINKTGWYGGTIVGGSHNNLGVSDKSIGYTTGNAFIGAGNRNSIGDIITPTFVPLFFRNNNSYYSGIVSGKENIIDRYKTDLSFIGGGRFNQILGYIGDTNGRPTRFNSIVGGYQNSILSGATGSIVGGGRNNKINGGYYAFIGAGTNNYVFINILEGKISNSSVVGGSNNQIFSKTAFIGGGRYNNIYNSLFANGGTDSVIVGGAYNKIMAGNFTGIGGFIGGGVFNTLDNSTKDAFIGGGAQHVVGGQYTFIGGGYGNRITGGTTNHSSIVGGYKNKLTNTKFTFIGGGKNNKINSYYYSSIVGGKNNNIIDGYANFVGGGSGNVIETGGGSNCVIVGGRYNSINKTTTTISDAAIISGYYNNINQSPSSFIGSGYRNSISSNGNHIYNSIVGGGFNYITNSQYAFIGGGNRNFITAISNNSFIVGGYNNVVSATTYSLIGNGNKNRLINSGRSSIVGGSSNIMTDVTHSFIGGGTGNTVSSNYSIIIGGRKNTVAAYGHTSIIVGGMTNAMGQDYGFIGGGKENSVNGYYYSSIVGGHGNSIASGSAHFIGGGISNYIQPDGGSNCVIVGGANNRIDRTSGGVGNSLIVGGYGNEINQSTNTSIVGGYLNTITSVGNQNYNFIGGGGSNNMTNAQYAVIGGGYNNLISNSHYNSIGGGYGNSITGSSWNSSIVGGQANSISTTRYSFIGGGRDNGLKNTKYSFIGGGKSNYINTQFGPYNYIEQHNVIVGGYNNKIHGPYLGGHFIGGGWNNNIGNGYGYQYASFNIIVGGKGNDMSDSTNFGFIGGGYNNTAAGGNPTIVGGKNNTASGRSFIGGGGYNTAQNAFILGGNSNSATATSSVIGGGYKNTIVNTSPFSSILAGQLNRIDGIANTHIIGSNITATTANTTYVERLNIKTVNTGSTATEIFVREANGSVNTRSVDSIMFTGNTSGNCISELWVTNLHSCSPLIINSNDEGNVYFGSTSGVTIDVANSRLGINTNAPTSSLDVRGSAVFNESGGNFDFRVEGDTNTHLIFVDASADRVGINTTTLDGKFNVATTMGDGLVFDGMTNASVVGKHKHYTKQSEANTSGVGTGTLISVATASGDRITIKGIITAVVTGGFVIGGEFMAVASNVAGVLTIAGTVNTSIKHNAAGSPTFTVSTSGSNLIVTVTGGGEVTSWMSTYEYQIVAPPQA